MGCQQCQSAINEEFNAGVQQGKQKAPPTNESSQLNPSEKLRQITLQPMLNNLLPEVIGSIVRSPQRYSLIQKEAFEQILLGCKKIYLDPNQNLSLVSYLVSYMQQCCNRTTPQHKINLIFMREFGERIFNLQNQAYFDCKKRLKILSYLQKNALKFGCFLDLEFELKMEQTLSVAEKTRDLYEHDRRCFLFLSSYLFQSCLNLQKSKKTIEQINQILEGTLKQIAIKFPPALSLGEQATVLKYYRSQKDYPQQIWDASQIENSKRRLALEAFIVERADDAKKNLKDFTNLVYQICVEKGNHLKIGLKVIGKDHKEAIQRVMQKITKTQFRKYQIQDYLANKPQQKRSLNNFMQQEKQFVEKQLYDYFEKITHPLVFNISDMLRGKCLFQSVRDINLCAQKLLMKIKNQGYFLLELENRLSKNTSDIVIKIKIGQTVAQLQLCIESSVFQNQFNHKIYQILRSTLSPLINLQKFNQKFVDSWIPQITKCIASINKETTHEQQQKYFQTETSFHAFSNLFDQFIEKMRYKSSKEEIINEELLKLCKTYQSLLSCKKILPSNEIFAVSKNSGYFYYSIQRYDKCCQKLQDYLKQIQGILKNEIQIMSEKIDVNTILGMSCIHIGKFSEAHKYFQANCQLSNHQSFIKDSSSHYMKNADLYNMQNDLPQAAHHYKLALQIEEKIKSTKSSACLTILNGIALIYQKQGKLNEARILFEECLKRIPDKESLLNCEAYKNLGNLYRMEGKHGEALSYFSRCLEIEVKETGEDSLQAATTLNGMGIVYQEQRKFTEALKIFQKSLQIKQKIKGKQHLICASTLHDMGIIFQQINELETALAFYERSLKIKQKSCGQDSIQCASTINNIGIVYKLMNDYEKSLKYFLRSLKIKQKAKGNGSIECASTLLNIGSLYTLMDNFKQATFYYNRSLNIKQHIKGRNNVDFALSLKAIADLLSLQRAKEEAQLYYRECLTIYENIKGPLSMEAAFIHFALGNMFVIGNSEVNALASYMQAKKIYVKLFGQNCKIVQVINQQIRLVSAI